MKKIIIADNDHKTVMMLEYSLKKAGYEVFIARDGSELLEILKTEIPDLILLDVTMPNIDKYSTRLNLRKYKKFENIKLIFLSSKTVDADIQKRHETGADGYVIKPYSIKKLCEKVDELLK